MEDDNNTASKLMNDEIKEILDKLNYLVKNEMSWWENYTVFSPKDTKQLLDYITNLQQEKEDYKSRIEKASSLIEPLVEWGECTINGKMLKSVYDILNDEE